MEIMNIVLSLDKERNQKEKIVKTQKSILQNTLLLDDRKPLAEEIRNQINTLKITREKVEQDMQQRKTTLEKEFKNKESIAQLQKIYANCSRRIKPKISNGANPFSFFYAYPYAFEYDPLAVQQLRPAQLPEQLWNNFARACEERHALSLDAAERTDDLAQLEIRLQTHDDQSSLIQQSKENTEESLQSLHEELLKTMVDVSVPFTFRQGQVEIPTYPIIVDFTDVVLIEKQSILEANRLINIAGDRKVKELEEIRKERAAANHVRWEIDFDSVLMKNLVDEIQEYKLFRPSKDDQELINGGGTNLKQRVVISLRKSLDHTTTKHFENVAHARFEIKTLKNKIASKKAENQKIEDEIIQMQLNLKEKKRIYKIQIKNDDVTKDARKRRLKQVMMISKLKRARLAQETQIAELKTEVRRLRNCVYTSFVNNEKFDPSTNLGKADGK
jgi:hypothetical protein